MFTSRFMSAGLVVLMVVGVASASAQAQTSQDGSVKALFGNGTFTSGGFGGPVVKLTSMRGDASLLIGGRGAWIINSTLAIGGGGYGLVTPTTLIEADSPTEYDTVYNVGYGGLEIEVVLWADEVVHGSVMTLIGAGGVSTSLGRTGSGMHWGGRAARLSDDAFFVVEPQVNVEVNVTSWFRLALGAGYRYVNGVDPLVGTASIDDSDLSGMSGVLTFKFGTY